MYHIIIKIHTVKLIQVHLNNIFSSKDYFLNESAHILVGYRDFILLIVSGDMSWNAAWCEAVLPRAAKDI